MEDKETKRDPWKEPEHEEGRQRCGSGQCGRKEKAFTGRKRRQEVEIKTGVRKAGRVIKRLRKQ